MNNQNQNQNQNLIQRLDPSPVLKQIELFLRGKQYKTIKQNGEWKRVEIDRGGKKANERGINSIMEVVTSNVNQAVVQGYFPESKFGESKAYKKRIYQIRTALIEDLCVNRKKYGINEDELAHIYEFIMNIIIPFLSRLIGDRERKTLTKTMQNIQRVTQTQKKEAPDKKSALSKIFGSK